MNSKKKLKRFASNKYRLVRMQGKLRILCTVVGRGRATCRCSFLRYLSAPPPPGHPLAGQILISAAISTALSLRSPLFAGEPLQRVPRGIITGDLMCCEMLNRVSKMVLNILNGNSSMLMTLFDKLNRRAGASVEVEYWDLKSIRLVSTKKKIFKHSF